MPSTTNLEEEEIVGAPGKDGDASMPKQVSRPKPWRRRMMMMMMMKSVLQCFHALIRRNIKLHLANHSDTRWPCWLKHCTKHRKVAGSIPDGVIGVYHWHNASGRTKPLTEMSTTNICRYARLVTLMYRMFWSVVTLWVCPGFCGGCFSNKPSLAKL